MADDPTFFQFQEYISTVLWRWGLASVAVGLPALFVRNTVVRQAAIQSIAWGGFDAALAFFGRRSARERMERGAPDALVQARRFRLIVAVNTGLDVGYVAGGLRLIRTARGRAERAGMGLGIVVQGLFLLLFDSALTWFSSRWARERAHR